MSNISRFCWCENTDSLELPPKETSHPFIARRKKPSLTKISSQQFLMTTILEEPYMMLRKAKPGELLRGNDRYEGYCKVSHLVDQGVTNERLDCRTWPT